MPKISFPRQQGIKDQIFIIAFFTKIIASNLFVCSILSFFHLFQKSELICVT